jgi:hypothetical protein
LIPKHDHVTAEAADEVADNTGLKIHARVHVQNRSRFGRRWEGRFIVRP